MPIEKLGPLMRAIKQRDSVNESEQARIETLPRRTQSFRKGEELVRDGDRPSESCLVLRGFTVRVNRLRSGSRQITSIHIPGDFVDLPAMLIKLMDHSIEALTDCEVCFIPHLALRELIAQEAHLARLLWLMTMIDSSIQREWITALGRKSAEARLAHLICEMYVRLEGVGLGRDFSFDMPATQEVLSDMIGISPVHLNRTLKELRRTGYVVRKRGEVKINNFPALAALAEFDPGYLNLRKEPR